MAGVKNPTPRQIALAVAGITSAATLVVLGLLYGLHLFVGPWLTTALILAGVFAASYYANVYYLRQYIYRKIKLIYKSIHKHKTRPRNKRASVDMDADIIQEMEREVADWADTQAQEIQELKTWQEYRRRFIGDISHELKTPIFSIQGYLETLLDGGLENPDINRRYLQRAANNVDRLVTIVDDLNSISKLESGQFEIDPQPFDIRELVEEVFEDLELSARGRKVELVFKAGADQGYEVVADRESIRQVLMNLLSNSIKYGREQGHTKVGFYDMDQHILIEVADNGIGIKGQHLKHVFDRFYRVDKSRSRAQGGSGLGLSIVKHIMEAHAQTINVRSSEDRGSTFGFTLDKA